MITKTSRLVFAMIAIAALVLFTVANHPARAGDSDRASVDVSVQMDQQTATAEAAQSIQSEVASQHAEPRVSYAPDILAVTTERRGLRTPVDWRSRHETRSTAQTSRAEDTSANRPTEAVLRT